MDATRDKILGRRGALVLLAVSVLPITQAGFVAPVLGALADAFGDWANPALLAQIVLVAPTLAIVLTAPLMGWIADHDRNERLMVAAMFLFGICGIWSYLAASAQQILAARVLLGLAVAALLAATPLAIARRYHGPDRQRFLGLQASAVGLAGALTPTIGGLIGGFGWRYVFIAYLIAWAIAPLVLLRLVDRDAAAAPAANTAAPVLRGLGRAAPICGLVFLLWLVLYFITTQLAFHMRDLGLTSPAEVGLGIGLGSAAAAISSLAYGRIKLKTGYVEIAALAWLLTGFGYVVIAFAGGRLALAAGLILSGLGFGLNVPNATAWLIEIMPAEIRGRALGCLAVAMYLGQLTSVFLHNPLVLSAGTQDGFLAMAGVSGIMALVLYLRAAARVPAQTHPAG